MHSRRMHDTYLSSTASPPCLCSRRRCWRCSPRREPAWSPSHTRTPWSSRPPQRASYEKLHVYITINVCMCVNECPHERTTACMCYVYINDVRIQGTRACGRRVRVYVPLRSRHRTGEECCTSLTGKRLSMKILNTPPSFKPISRPSLPCVERNVEKCARV